MKKPAPKKTPVRTSRPAAPARPATAKRQVEEMPDEMTPAEEAELLRRRMARRNGG